MEKFDNRILNFEYDGKIEIPPLIAAVIDGDYDAVIKLYADGVKDALGRTPLHYAVLYGVDISIVKLLMKYANSKDNDGVTPYTYALDTDNDELIELLGKMEIFYNRTIKFEYDGKIEIPPLIAAVIDGDYDAVIKLYADGVKDTLGRSPLHYAVMYEVDISIVNLLLKYVKIKDNDGLTPYNYALDLENGELIELLSPMASQKPRAEPRAEEWDNEFKNCWRQIGKICQLACMRVASEHLIHRVFTDEEILLFNSIPCRKGFHSVAMKGDPVQQLSFLWYINEINARFLNWQLIPETLMIERTVDFKSLKRTVNGDMRNTAIILSIRKYYTPKSGSTVWFKFDLNSTKNHRVCCIGFDIKKNAYVIKNTNMKKIHSGTDETCKYFLKDERIIKFASIIRLERDGLKF
jgi:hypothetical protein